LPLIVVDRAANQFSIEPRFAYCVVAEALDQVIEQSETPQSITVESRYWLTSESNRGWAYQRGVKLDFTHPGKPVLE
jgi:hypothetical protein